MKSIVLGSALNWDIEEKVGEIVNTKEKYSI
jgi:hypothetical protein